MIFAVNVINHTTPQVSVTVADSGVPAVTYSQIKNSLGTHIYNVERLYLNSNILQQLIGTIQYNRYDVDGNQNYNSIATTVDPYQPAKAINVDLKPYKNMFILNGNSNFSATILPLALVQVTLYCKRITNSFGANLNSFKIMEQIFRKPNFFTSYGDIDEIQKSNAKVAKSASFDGGYESDKMPITILSLVAVYAGMYYLVKNKYF
jgi:hypothetical protein